MVSLRRILLAGLLCISLTLAALPTTSHVSADTIAVPAGDVTALIEAINEANGTLAADEIVLAENATYTLTGAVSEETGLPTISSEITIIGNGSTIARSGDSGTDIFRILHVVSGGTLHVNDLTITNGEAAFGGGILNEGGIVTLTGSTVTDNSAIVSGGGIYNDSGTVTLIDSTVTANTSSAEGGGMYNFQGTLSLTGSTVSLNESGSTGGGLYSESGTLELITSTVDRNTAYSGAGIGGNAGTVTLTDSTVSDNTASSDGGGIHNAASILTLANSTLSGNAAIFGGGIHNHADTVFLTNSTISNNAASLGGGIYSGAGIMTLTNTIVAANTGLVFIDISGSATIDSSHNLIGNGLGLTGLTNGSNGNQVGTIASPIDPLLGGLTDNGGPTQTMALLEGSPAIDAGDDDAAPETDQRGLTRPQGPASDIGAFELDAPDETPPVITPNVSGTLGNNGWYTSDVSVTWTVEDPDSPITSTDNCEVTTITTDTTGTTLTCTATSAGGENSESVTIKRDTTGPVITYSGNQGNYGPADTISITCDATDATSGVVSDTCEDITGSAMSFGPGVYTFSATATDAAGNTGSGSTSFTIGATYDGLCQLTREVVRQPSVSRTACSVLALAELADASGNVMLEQLALLNYEAQIRSAMGRRYVSPADGAMLIAWARSM